MTINCASLKKTIPFCATWTHSEIWIQIPNPGFHHSTCAITLFTDLNSSFWFHLHSVKIFFFFSKPVLAQKISLPHVFALWETFRDLDLPEVLDALFQLLFHTHFFFGRSLFADASVPGTRSEGAKKVALAPLLRLLLLQ